MAELNPWAILRVCDDVSVFGSVDYEGDGVTWPLSVLQTRPGASFRGLIPDPTGDYFMQAPVTLWQDSGTGAWSPASGTYSSGLDTAVQTQGGTHPSTLYQSNPSGQTDTSFTAAFSGDEGMVLHLWAGAPPAGSQANFFVYFNAGLRLAVEAGQPIRLQTPDASGNWSNLAVAQDPDGESYLQRWDGRLDVDVLAQTDPNWTPDDGQYSDAPPSRIVVTLNGGDEQLVIPASTLPAGYVRVTGLNRQWGALVGRKRFAVSAAVTTPPVTHPVEFQGYPLVDFAGYVPAYFSYAPGLSIGISPGGSNFQAVATLTIAVPSGGIDSTGYAVRSVYLTAIRAEFPAQQTPPLDSPDWADYLPVHARAELTWDQTNSLGRSHGEVTFVDADGSFAPGADGVLPAARAFRLYMGELPGGVVPTPDNLFLVMSGYTGLRPGDGFRWRCEGGLTYVTLSLDDRLIKADKACLYVPAGDGACHYYVMRQAAYRCGFVDAQLNFPYCAKYQPGEYQLSYGTAENPKFQPHPADMLMGHMLEVRADSGDVDPVTAQVQPMVLGCAPDGGLDYFPLPVGVVQSFLDPGQDPAVYGLIPDQAFSAIPLFGDDGSPLLNEMLQFLETVAALDQIRSEAVFAGLDIATGAEVLGYALNPQLTQDPNAFGYIGAVRSAYVQISRRVSSLPVAERQAQIAQVLLAFPAIRAAVVGHLQAWIGLLGVISVQNYATQGTDSPVGYFSTSLIHEVGTNQDGTRYGLTHVGGKPLGQAGD